MTNDSARKQRIRQRMRETGEKYSVAARAVHAARRLGPNEAGDPAAQARGWLSAYGVELRDAVDTWMAGSTRPEVEIDNAEQVELVEGGMQRATLEEFAAEPTAPLELVDVDVVAGVETSFELHVVIPGRGDIIWTASASGESSASDEGFVDWEDADVPVELHVTVRFDATNARWRSLEVETATVPTDEVIEQIRADEDRRFRHH